jgi:hypothetical protein
VYCETGKGGNPGHSLVASQGYQELCMLPRCEQIVSQRLGRLDGDPGGVLWKEHKTIYSNASVNTQLIGSKEI